MSNGENYWNVSYAKIMWLKSLLETHKNVYSVTRQHDILFDVVRIDESRLKVLCLDEYALGEAGVHRALQEFPEVHIISVGGNWNGYTPEAKELCLSYKIGLYNSTELSGALWKNDYWAFSKKDKDGNPEYPLAN